MKTKILLLFLLGWAGIVYSQIENKVFELDLGNPDKNSLTVKDKEDESPRLVIKARQLLSFELKNSNPYKYKYVINHKFVDLFEGQGYNSLDSIGKIITNRNSAQVSNSVSSLTANSLLDSIKFLNRQKQIFSIKALGRNEKIKSIDEDLERLTEKYLKLSLSEDSSLSIYSTNFINGITAKNAEEDKANIKKASRVLQKSFEDLKIKIDDYILEVSAEDFLDRKRFEEHRRNFNNSYGNLLISTQNISNEAESFPEILNDFNKKMKVIDSVSVKIKNEISKMNKLKLYNYLLPIDTNGKNIDVVEVVLERYDKSVVNPTPDRYTYNIWIKGGLKIDISGGIFLTSLMDEEYETKEDTGNNKFIYEKDRGNYDFGFGSLINLSLRGGSWARPTLSIGALFTTNQKFQILSGIGLILGKEERIVLHGGLTMGAVSKISSRYKADGGVSYDLGAEGSIPMNNKFSFGHFFGVTYNFGKVKKQESSQ